VRRQGALLERVVREPRAPPFIPVDLPFPAALLQGPAQSADDADTEVRGVFDFVARRSVERGEWQSFRIIFARLLFSPLFFRQSARSVVQTRSSGEYMAQARTCRTPSSSRARRSCSSTSARGNQRNWSILPMWRQVCRNGVGCAFQSGVSVILSINLLLPAVGGGRCDPFGWSGRLHRISQPGPTGTGHNADEAQPAGAGHRSGREPVADHNQSE